MDAVSNTKEEISKKKQRNIKRQVVKLSCHFQITYYHFSRGRRRAPLQVMMGESVYGKTRSKGLISNLNTIGVTTSYPSVKRHR